MYIDGDVSITGKQCPYKVGDKVVVLSGKDAEWYSGYWYGEGMDKYVGNVYTVAKVEHSDEDNRARDVFRLLFVEDDGEYVFDHRYVASVCLEEGNPEIDNLLEEF